MNIIKNGDKVTLLDSGIIATVIGVCIRGIDNQTFEYNVTWFSGGSIQDVWLQSFLVERFVDTKRKAGMVNYEDDGIKKLS